MVAGMTDETITPLGAVLVQVACIGERGEDDTKARAHVTIVCGNINDKMTVVGAAAECLMNIVAKGCDEGFEMTLEKLTEGCMTVKKETKNDQSKTDGH
jgi:hypothetical protein